MKIRKRLKDNRTTLITIGAILLMILILYICLFTRSEAVTKNPIDGLNQSRSQVLITGESFSLNKNQEEEQKKEEQKREEQNIEKKRQGEYESLVIGKNQDGKNSKEDGDSNRGDGKGSGKPGEKDNGEEDNKDKEEPEEEDNGGEKEKEDTSKNPIIITDLKDNETIKGAKLSFTVEARTFKNHSIGGENIKVYINEAITYPAGGGSAVRLYRKDLKDLNEGNNTVKITAYDPAQEKSTTIIRTAIYNKDFEPEKKNVATVTVEARTIGLGILINNKQVLFGDGETIPDVLERALEEEGYTCIKSGTNNYGYYISRIKKPGITAGYKIPEAIKNKLLELGEEDEGGYPDSLGEKDFYQGSGFTYSLNDSSPDKGMADNNLADGDKIEMMFTTKYGNEYNGNWFSGSW